MQNVARDGEAPSGETYKATLSYRVLFKEFLFLGSVYLLQRPRSRESDLSLRGETKIRRSKRYTGIERNKFRAYESEGLRYMYIFVYVIKGFVPYFSGRTANDRSANLRAAKLAFSLIKEARVFGRRTGEN